MLPYFTGAPVDNSTLDVRIFLLGLHAHFTPLKVCSFLMRTRKIQPPNFNFLIAMSQASAQAALYVGPVTHEIL